MENASKALIIAAAVLITILIISLAMFIVNSSSETSNSSRNTMSELEINSFNYKFKTYEGSRKTSSRVAQLLKLVASSNSSNDNKIAVKLSGVGSASVYDSHSYAIFDENNNLIKCNANNIVSLDEIITIVNSYKAYNYTVTFYYCNQKSQYVGNNEHLNPVAGCILLIHISKNF